MRAKMNNWSGWVTQTRVDVLMAQYRRLLLQAGFGIRNEVHCFFAPHGFTALFLLSQSHFAIHTFPEEQRTYLELSSCVDVPFKRFVEAIGVGEEQCRSTEAR